MTSNPEAIPAIPIELLVIPEITPATAVPCEVYT